MLNILDIHYLYDEAQVDLTEPVTKTILVTRQKRTGRKLSKLKS